MPSSSHTTRIALLLAPALTVIVGLFAGGLALAAAESFGFFAPAGEASFTLRHYLALATDKEFHASLRFTLAVASTATLISAALGLALALALRDLARRARVLTTLLQVPLAVPHLAVAVALVNFISQSGLIARALFHLGLLSEPADFPALTGDAYGAGIILAYVLKETPFIALMTLALLVRVGDEYEQLAQTLGASRWQRLRYVTLPLVAPALVSSSLLVFTFLFSAFEVPFLLGRPYPAMLAVVAQRRYLEVDLAARPGAAAVGVVMAVITGLAAWVYLRLARTLVGAERAVVI